jgi:hypothetical protein
LWKSVSLKWNIYKNEFLILVGSCLLLHTQVFKPFATVIFLCVVCTMCMKWMHIGLTVCACLFMCFNSRTAGQILMKYGMDMPLETITHTNMANAQTFEVGCHLTLWNQSSSKYLRIRSIPQRKQCFTITKINLWTLF